jgi:hypothetical protein
LKIIDDIDLKTANMLREHVISHIRDDVPMSIIERPIDNESQLSLFKEFLKSLTQNENSIKFLINHLRWKETDRKLKIKKLLRDFK